jgi:hypothetical protein
MALYKWSTKLAGISNWFSPSNVWTTGQVLTKTATGYAYADAPVKSVNGQTGDVTIESWWIQNDTTGTTTRITGIRWGTEAEYWDLSQKDSSVLYFTF